MNVLCKRQPALVHALLTQWVLLDISVPDLLPTAAIPLAWLVLASVTFVVLVDLSLMFLAVTLVCQLRTVRISTRMLGLHWHDLTSTGHEKSRC